MAYKIVDADKLDSKLHDLADKIRAKNYTTEGLDFFAGDFSEAVDNITGRKEEQEKILTVTENGTYEVVPDAEKVLSKVDVDVAVPLRYDEGYSAGYDSGYSKGYETSQDSITLQEKTVTENGEVTADEGYTGLSKVTVDVPERKEEQEKSLVITKDGSYEVIPDENKALSKVYVEVQNETVAEIETAIDESGVLDSTEGTVEEKVEQVIDKAEDADLWYIASSKLTRLDSGFNPIFQAWAYNKLPRTDFSNITTLSYAINATQLEYIDFYINSSKCTNVNNVLSHNKKLKWIVGIDLSSATSIYAIFLSSIIETIQEPLNVAKATNAQYAFQDCPYLKDIRFIEECIKVSIGFPHSNQLTAESIQSIINGLATVETQQKLTLHSSAVTNLTDEQLTTIANKNWTIG